MSPSFLWRAFQALRGTNSKVLTTRDVPDADLRGKWIIISGSNNGIGFEAAKSFSRWGANLILACREPPASELHPTVAVQECKDLANKMGHASTIEWWELDMADLDSVEAFARRWLESDRALDILCNNAGTTSSSVITKDGFQLVHQVRLLSMAAPKNEQALTKPLGQLLITRTADPPAAAIPGSQRRASNRLHDFMHPLSRRARSRPLQWRSQDER